jgi:hypothetical protein
MVKQLQRNLPGLLLRRASQGICGAACGPSTLSNAVSSKSGEEPGPWSASSTFIRGPNHLLHLPEIQSGSKKQHPPRFYAGGLTSTPIRRNSNSKKLA